ncbi:DNA repair and recombination RAD54B [Lecanosticta acicola]|uniref:DNA repair and recombination RAD54B n=1 Tax=Lecanosticta acicola TaxID=111012 RepID=A0AAI8YRR2_9PEZI|nr:DNA repair and recombination RAD54B [Lecanosticta acicola]
MTPFKPPTFKPPTFVKTPLHDESPAEPPAKKRRISQDDETVNLEATKAAVQLLKRPAPPRKFVPPPARQPLAPVSNPSTPSQSESSETLLKTYYTVLWRKFTTKKNKTWDGDGVLTVLGSSAVLQDDAGKELGRGTCKGPLLVGSELSVGGKDVQVESMIPKEEYTSGRVFLAATKPAPAQSLKQINGTARVTNKEQAKHDKIAATQKERLVSSAVTSKAGKASFKAPLIVNTVQVPKKNATIPVPRHDPKAEDAVLMRRPSSAPRGKQIVDVVVDPLLSRKLHAHQREGVAFMYECVMGMMDYVGEGAILADEMGLGKTLQTIALLWTLLKQNPIYEDGPVIKKALIVCPVTLINNWQKEFRKWLGNERIGVFVAENNKMRLTDFTRGRAYHVMIIGYEKLTKVQDQLKGDCGIDIVIADEGHRLKAEKNKAAAAIKSINTDRRIILSGTPIQNDLSEFYQMVDFVNPNILGKKAAFRREFEDPIVKSRQPGASASDVEKGEARSEHLAGLTRNFILRRTADVMAKFLPPRTDYVVFCKPTPVQASVYRSIIGSQAFLAAMHSPKSALQLINVLKKACNSPSLLLKANDEGEGRVSSELLEDVSPSDLRFPGTSGKVRVLDSLLREIYTATDEKVVVVSNYTSTLDVLANLMTSMDYQFLRLDGATPKNKRQELVDRFNNSPQKAAFVFLLSTKAGGVGINLIGASRLILFDSDWNPSNDLQAMARVHRFGQRRTCFIYRLLVQGALDEKIFQRQVSKTGLADSIVDRKSNASGFTQAELRDLFTFDENDDCQTHRLLGCTCGGNGLPIGEAARESAEKAQVARNDLVTLSGNDETEVLYLADSDEEANVNASKGAWRGTAKDYDPDAVEEEHRRQTQEGKMLSLMQWTHFNTGHVTANASDQDDTEASELDEVGIAVEDDALRTVMREPGRRVGYVFAKLSASTTASHEKPDAQAR